MKYLTQASEIQAQIAEFASAQTLWLDTEVADWQTKQPRLSLIQVLANPQDLTGKSVCLLDVLDRPDLVTQFVSQIMANPNITKVFHNASYDLSYLGKHQAQNVVCTLKMARKIGKDILQVSNLKLKTLAAELCWFPDVSSEEQSSDWGRRSLTPQQLHYAAMDVVYLATVHQQLLQRLNSRTPAMNPTSLTPELPPLTPTKVRIALECPRLFYLHQKFDRKALFVPGDAIGGVGNAFHQLAEKFIQLARLDPDLKALFKPVPEQLQAAEIAVQMQQQFFKQVFSPYLQNAVQQDENRATSLLQVWQGLQSLIRQFAELLVLNRHHCNPESLMRNTFVEAEHRLTHSFDLPNGTQQQVTGEFDCLVYNFQRQRLAVVEFKTYQPVDPSAQLAQVALYSYMLWTRRNVPIDSIVYCVLPGFKEYHYSWEQMETTVYQLIPHKLQQMQAWLTWQPQQPDPPPPTTQAYLCEICPQQQKCQAFFVSESQPAIEEITVAAASENSIGNSAEQTIEQIESESSEYTATDEIADQLVQTLQAFKIDVTYHGSIAAPAFIRVKLKPSLGVKVSSILKFSDDLRVQLGLTAPPLIAPQAGYVSVDLPRPDRQAAIFDTYIQPVSLPPTAAIKIAIGVNIEGQLIEADLSDPNTCHFLVGGTTGSGKSEFLRSLLLSLLVRHSHNHLRVALVDPKRVTFPEFENMPWLYKAVVKDSDRAIELMEDLVAEMESRYQKFEVSRCNDLSRYNQQCPEANQLPRIVCIFDEYADFMAEKEIAKNLELNIKRLGAMARAAGIHLIIATQRPEAKIVTPVIRSNLPGRVALRTASEADSMIVLGGKQTEAAYLLGKGDLLYQSGATLSRLQSLFAPKIHLPR